jgi:hypothetical protein
VTLTFYPVAPPGIGVATEGDPAFKGMWRCRQHPEVTVLVTRTLSCGWHLSLAHPSRLPTWEEARDARYQLIPDAATMALLLPPRAEYVNVHEFCLQMIEAHGEVRLRGERYSVIDDLVAPEPGGLTVGELQDFTGLTAPDIDAALLELEAEGKVEILCDLCGRPNTEHPFPECPP